MHLIKIFSSFGEFNIQEAGDRFFKAFTKGPNPKFKTPPGMDNQGTNYSQTGTYDKIAWIDRPDFKFAGNFGVVPFGEVLYKEPGQPANAARKEISDHLPLWCEFKINELTNEHQKNNNIKSTISKERQYQN